jgi:hypothetical protein
MSRALLVVRIVMGMAKGAAFLETSARKGVTEGAASTVARGAMCCSIVFLRGAERADEFTATGEGLMPKVETFETLSKRWPGDVFFNADLHEVNK